MRDRRRKERKEDRRKEREKEQVTAKTAKVGTRSRCGAKRSLCNGTS